MLSGFFYIPILSIQNEKKKTLSIWVLSWVSPISPTPVLPTFISPTKNQTVAFCLLSQKQFFDTKTNIGKQLSLKDPWKMMENPFQQQGVKGCLFHFAQALIGGYPHLSFFYSFHTPDHCTSFCASSICTTTLEAAKITAPNLPRVDVFCNIRTLKEHGWQVSKSCRALGFSV